MVNEIDAKLVKIINDNKKWPLIIESVSSVNSPDFIMLPASTPSSDLGIVSDENGYNVPAWIEEIEIRSQAKKQAIVCIDGLDEILPEEQEKFFGMIKYKGVNGYKFPEDTQIIITVKDVTKISKRILNLALVYKLEK